MRRTALSAVSSQTHDTPVGQTQASWARMAKPLAARPGYTPWELAVPVQKAVTPVTPPGIAPGLGSERPSMKLAAVDVTARWDKPFSTAQRCTTPRQRASATGTGVQHTTPGLQRAGLCQTTTCCWLRPPSRFSPVAGTAGFYQALSDHQFVWCASAPVGKMLDPTDEIEPASPPSGYSSPSGSSTVQAMCLTLFVCGCITTRGFLHGHSGRLGFPLDA